ncbi:LacI family DNA-binding transcriptional regulator [Tellurirhabdus bombi]|uniref:LacI family DNA-binding transcriptional regulator n=1 Tax=Tellurirhabdus bombi TaxID=2907205 RepID=UPI001F386C86|nr:LacI family DNA-binding transcriptional regulator [Tellurirhabdus bombi]
MKKTVKNFLLLAKSLEYGIIAKHAGASYQTVSKFANRASNEKPSTKHRIIDAMILLGKQKIADLEQELVELEQWRREFLPEREKL